MINVINDGTAETNSHWTKFGNQRPILCVDFDHTITVNCLACDPKQTKNEVQPGAREVLTELSKYFRIIIYTGCTTKERGFLSRTIEDIEKILRDNKIPFDEIQQTKPPACFIIDDRAVHHTSWHNTLTEVKNRANLW